MRFALDGEMPPWLLAKDLILHIIGEISVSGELAKFRCRVSGRGQETRGARGPEYRQGFDEK